MAEETHLQGVGRYRSKDPLQNFRIRVRLKKINGTSLSSVPSFGSEGAELQTLGIEKNNDHECIFAWQEKVFNQQEVEFYGNKSNCKNYLQEKYHQKVLELSERQNVSNKLFSYINPETYDLSELKLLASSKEQTSFLSEKYIESRNKSKPAKPFQKVGKVLPNMNIVDENPNEEAKKSCRIINNSSQRMFIMVDFKHDGSIADSKKDEVILCEISADCNNSVISVLPDFNCDISKPYVLNYHSNGVKETYTFTIEHLSKNISELEKFQELKLYKELSSRRTELVSSSINSTFEIPATGVLKVCIYGEIVSAKNFEYDNLFIHYFLESTSEWTVHNPSDTFNFTQTSKTTCDGKFEVAHFCHVFTFELDLKINELDSNHAEKIPKWPTLYLEVLSLDSWGRFRTEGYGYLSIPNIPGMHDMEVKTWRPLTESCIGELRRFFIGGSPRLEDLTFASTPSSFEEKQLSKFGFQTITSGTVQMRFNILHQSQAYLAAEHQKKRVGNLLEKLGAATIHSGVAAVLLAFQRARQRMMAARERSSKPSS